MRPEKLGEDNNLSASERLLLNMHNLCLVKPKIAKSGDELAKTIQVTRDSVTNILGGLEAEGYVKSFDEGGTKKFYLTRTGILKVCSVFT